MKLRVTKSEGAMVRPCKPTPSGRLPLSTIDQLPALRRKVQTLHVFKHGDANVAETIRLGLSKALVHYYPLAGRLVENADGLLQVDCTGQGVWFVQASADHRLDALRYFDSHPTADMLHFELLAGTPPTPSPANTAYSAAVATAASSDDHDKKIVDQYVHDDPLVLIQVTSFACNGFTMGLEFSHCVCDGLGAAQFLNAVAELARGLPLPSLSPAWARDGLLVRAHVPTNKKLLLGRTTTQQEEEYHPPPPLEPATVDVSLDQIAHLKREFFSRTGRTCSAFEAITATIWRARTRAINIRDRQTEMRLVFFTNTRPMMVDPPLPRGFYGNCFFPVNVTAPAGRLLEGSCMDDVVALIQEAKARVNSEWADWMAGGSSTHQAYDPPLTYNTLFVSEWGRLGFGSINYGWGPPVHMMPIERYSNAIPGCILLCSPPPPMTPGIRLMTWCVQGIHITTFCHELTASI